MIRSGLNHRGRGRSEHKSIVGSSGGSVGGRRHAVRSQRDGHGGDGHHRGCCGYF